MKTSPTRIKLITTFFFATVVLVSFLFMGGCESVLNSVSAAVYPGISFGTPNGQQFYKMTVDFTEETVMPLYVEMPDGNRYLLKDLPENEVAKFFVKDTYVSETMIGTSYKCNDHTNTSTSFWFRDGKLQSAYFNQSDSIETPFSPKKEGPYYKLPITREVMEELFGKPTKWRRHRTTKWCDWKLREELLDRLA